MKEWAVDAAGSEIGSLVGAAVGGIAIAAAAVAGTVLAAPLAGAIVLGGALVGGIFGADAGLWLYRTSGDRDDNKRIDFVDALYNLFLGPATTLSAPLPPDLDGGRYTIDAQLTRSELYANAKSEIAWRYTLRELNSFVVPDVDYTRHNSDGSLDLANEDGDGMTDNLLTIACVIPRLSAILSWEKLFFTKVLATLCLVSGKNCSFSIVHGVIITRL